MNTFETIKKFLAEGGKCLLIENGEPMGVILTIEEYELLRSKSQIPNPESLPQASPPKADQPWVGAEIADIASADDITLEDPGLAELPY